MDTQENITQETLEESTPVVQETPEEINWKKFRDERKNQRQAQLEAEAKAKKAQEEAAALKAALEALAGKEEAPKDEESEEKRLDAKIKEHLLSEKKRIEEEQRQAEQRELPQRLQSMHPDFADVCSQENLDYLEYHFPEIAKPYTYMPNSVEKWTLVYKAIKKMIPNTNSKNDEKKLDKNMSKPQSISAPVARQVGDSAPYILDEARRKSNYDRMQKVLKGL